MEVIYNKDNKVLFVNGVAFTKERLDFIRKVVKYGKVMNENFEYRITIIDQGTRAEVIIDENSLGIIYDEITESEARRLFCFDKTKI